MEETIENTASKIHELFLEWAAVEKPEWATNYDVGPWENQSPSRKSAYRYVARGLLEHLQILEIKS